MKFKIHRGTKEIGGSCVEVWTETTRIIVDFGMPLVEKNGEEFNMEKYKGLSIKERIKNGVLPNIEGIYKNEENIVDGVLLSHAHLDHYGLFNCFDPKLKCYLSRASHEIIKLNTLFTPQDIAVTSPVYFEKEKTFQIGDIYVTPYWADHSAFDSYSFLIEADGKSIFYSGDFRGHGRKSKVFQWFTHHAPQMVDYLLLEGTSIGRGSRPFKSEERIEDDFVSLFSETGKTNLVYTSGQNIDRLVSIYKACQRTNKTLVVDVYVAEVLKELSRFAKIPYPSKRFKNLQVMYPYFTCKRLTREGNEKILYKFKDYKITKEEISKRSNDIVMVVRPSMQKDLEKIDNINGGNLIYSMWEGYKKKASTKKLISYLEKRDFSCYTIHTSGHADVKTLIAMVDAIKPKAIVPIHTFESNKYPDIFSTPIIEMIDGDEIRV